ncbi:MAG: DNA polymerase I [Parachlamydiales bacterium]|nr:DNA polymerase I [Parachlamydiales bacterium]
MKKLFILDAVNYLFRSYYAIGPMTNDQGESTNALYGFIRSLQKLIRDFSPHYLIAVFDGPDNKRSRKTFYSAYKMHRKGAPEDLFSQFSLAHTYCETAGIPVISVEGVEADDTMASITTWGKKEGFEIYLCTSDKDLLQLVDKHVFVLNTAKNNLLYDTQMVEKVYGISPEQMLDYLSLTGDTSDNIPGVAGFGPKTASALLQEFTTLDNLLHNIDNIKSDSKRKALEEQKDKALLSKKLASLNIEVDFPHKQKFFALKEPDMEKLAQFYHSMKFTTLLKELNITPKKAQGKEREISYQAITTKEELDTLIETLQEQKTIVLDTETTDTHPFKAKLVGIGLGFSAAQAWYIPLNGPLREETILHKIKPLLENAKIAFCGHNLKYDYHVLLNYGITIKNIGFDTILASYLLQPQNRRHNLDQLALERFDKKKISIKSLIGEGKKQISMNDVPLEKITPYCCEDVDYTFRLMELFSQELQEKQLEKIFYEMELPLLPVLATMERHGIFIDVKKMHHLAEKFKKILLQEEETIFDLAGKKFNINSPKQLSDILYTHLQLSPSLKKGKALSTAAPILEKLAADHPIAEKILRYRGLQKLLSTYVETLPQEVHAQTGRIHTTFNQSVTATGRLSSQDPNVQNIPIRSQEGLQIRECFQPQHSSWSYLSSDYSQIELRLLAHFSEDPELIKAFSHDDDIHAYTASLVFHVPLKEVTPEMRQSAKAVNFGILYGQGPYGLSQQLNISTKEAKNIIDTYFQKFTKVPEYLEEMKKKAEKTLMTTTLFGRKRPIPEITSKNPQVKAPALRLAVNTPLQGTAADLIKIAMIDIDKEITKHKLKGFMILQIHDELLFEIPDTEIPLFKKFVKEKMENVIKLKIPLSVDIHVGKNWREC